MCSSASFNRLSHLKSNIGVNCQKVRNGKAASAHIWRVQSSADRISTSTADCFSNIILSCAEELAI